MLTLHDKHSAEIFHVGIDRVTELGDDRIVKTDSQRFTQVVSPRVACLSYSKLGQKKEAAVINVDAANHGNTWVELLATAIDAISLMKRRLSRAILSGAQGWSEGSDELTAAVEAGNSIIKPRSTLFVMCLILGTELGAAPIRSIAASDPGCERRR